MHAEHYLNSSKKTKPPPFLMRVFIAAGLTRA